MVEQRGDVGLGDTTGVHELVADALAHGEHLAQSASIKSRATHIGIEKRVEGFAGHDQRDRVSGDDVRAIAFAPRCASTETWDCRGRVHVWPVSIDERQRKAPSDSPQIQHSPAPH